MVPSAEESKVFPELTVVQYNDLNITSLVVVYLTYTYLSIQNNTKCYNFSEVIGYMRPLKEKISITLDSDLLEKLREKADEDCRPLSQYINLILRKYMEQKEKKQK